MSRSQLPGRIASVEDADESDNIIEGTSKYAASVASPTKEKPNTSRTRRDSRRRDPSPSFAHTDSDSTVHPVLERRQSLRAKGKARERFPESDRQIEKVSRNAAVVPMRPAMRHGMTTGDLRPRRESRDLRDIEASYYGVSPSNPVMTPAVSRPRAQTSNPRPVSYYDNYPTRPPQANARFWAAQPPPPVPLPTSYPPQVWAQTPQGVYPMGPPPVVPQPDYNFARPLESRFGPGRPQSAMSHRVSRSIDYRDYEQPFESEKQLARRPSQRKAAKTDMAPPPRPVSARPTTLAFRPPPKTPLHKRSVGFDDDDLTGEHDLFQDISPHVAGYDNRHSPAPPTRSRRQSVSHRSLSYDLGALGTTEISGNKSRRNSSYYTDHSVSSSSGYEDKVKQAQEYQEDVSGANSMPLTADALRKAGRNGGSSRSTRSSGSHDESDYRRSATTRTTRSSAENEDVTIRVKGLTTLKVGGTEMQCRDGAEIQIARGGGYRGGSDESSYLDQDDRRTRYERATTKTRVSSQAGSYSRGPPQFSMYEPHPMGPYDIQPGSYGTSPYGYPPPYPAYPQ